MSPSLDWGTMRKRIPLPPHTTLRGKVQHGHVHVRASKPPKLRWQPGQLITLDGQLFEIVYAFRIESEPSEWFFELEYRKSVQESLDAIGQLGQAFGCGDETPRVVYDLFRDHTAARSYFSDIPSNGDRRVVSNKTLMRGAQVVSSGVIV